MMKTHALIRELDHWKTKNPKKEFARLKQQISEFCFRPVEVDSDSANDIDLKFIFEFAEKISKLQKDLSVPHDQRIVHLMRSSFSGSTKVVYGGIPFLITEVVGIGFESYEISFTTNEGNIPILEVHCSWASPPENRLFTRVYEEHLLPRVKNLEDFLQSVLKERNETLKSNVWGKANEIIEKLSCHNKD